MSESSVDYVVSVLFHWAVVPTVIAHEEYHDAKKHYDETLRLPDVARVTIEKRTTTVERVLLDQTERRKGERRRWTAQKYTGADRRVIYERRKLC